MTADRPPRQTVPAVLGTGADPVRPVGAPDRDAAAGPGGPPGRSGPSVRGGPPVHSGVRFRRVPGISWALVFAGLLGGGALSFGAGVITGTQMTVVAYRGALPIATAPDPGPTAGAGGPSPPRTLLPRERQVAAHSNAATPAAVAGRRAGTPGSAAPAAPAAGADVTDVASLVSLPQRTRWQPPAPPQAGHAGEANPETRRSAAAARAAPPVPRPRPDGLAPQRLTPTDGTQGPGDAAAQHPSSAVPAAPIWRITAPSDAAALPGRWPLFPDGLARSTQLTPSAHWAPAPRESRTPDAGRTPQAAPPAPRPTPTDAAAAVVPQGRYSVQVGAFRDPANASAQAARLSAAGYTPRIVHARATQSRLYMVRLGAFPDRPAASAFASQIADRLDIDTWPVAN